MNLRTLLATASAILAPTVAHAAATAPNQMTQDHAGSFQSVLPPYPVEPALRGGVIAAKRTQILKKRKTRETTKLGKKELLEAIAREIRNADQTAQSKHKRRPAK